MPGNSKHSKNNLKMYVIIFAIFYVVDGRTILLSFICKLINHYIHIFNYPVI